jgi:hypothetical protein
MSDTVSPPGAGGPPSANPSAPGPSAGPPGMQGGSPVLAALARARGGQSPSAPGQGTMASSLMQVKQAIDMLQQALPGLMTGSEPHTAVITAIRALSRHMPQGAPTAGVQQTGLQDMLRNTLRNALLQRVMAAQGAGGAGGATPPSTPVPGA